MAAQGTRDKTHRAKGKRQREERAQGGYALEPTGHRHTCTSCEGEFDEVDMVPGEATCLHCHLAEEAAGGVDQGDTAWLVTTLAHLGAQVAAGGVAWWVHQVARPDQWAGFLMVAVVAALAGGLTAMNHAKQAPGRHPVRFPIMGLHALAMLGWLVTLGLTFFAL